MLCGDWQYYAKYFTIQTECEEYFVEYCQSHITLLWIWIRSCYVLPKERCHFKALLPYTRPYLLLRYLNVTGTLGTVRELWELESPSTVVGSMGFDKTFETLNPDEPKSSHRREISERSAMVGAALLRAGEFNYLLLHSITFYRFSSLNHAARVLRSLDHHFSSSSFYDVWSSYYSSALPLMMLCLISFLHLCFMWCRIPTLPFQQVSAFLRFHICCLGFSFRFLTWSINYFSVNQRFISCVQTIIIAMNFPHFESWMVMEIYVWSLRINVEHFIQGLVSLGSRGFGAWTIIFWKNWDSVLQKIHSFNNEVTAYKEKI